MGRKLRRLEMVMTMEEAAADWMWTPYSAAMAKSVVKAAQPQVCW